MPMAAKFGPPGYTEPSVEVGEGLLGCTVSKKCPPGSLGQSVFASNHHSQQNIAEQTRPGRHQSRACVTQWSGVGGSVFDVCKKNSIMAFNEEEQLQHTGCMHAICSCG